MKRFLIVVVIIVLGILGGVLSARLNPTGADDSLQRRESALRKESKGKLDAMRESYRSRAMKKRFEIAETRDGYTPLLEELVGFSSVSPKSYPIPDKYLRLLRAKSILPERRLHDDVVGLLRIGAYEREKVDHTLRVGWTHIALKVRSNATVDASNPKNVLVKIKGAPAYGKRVRKLMRHKISSVIGEQRMTVLFKLLDDENWIMDYGCDTHELRFYPLGKNSWGFVGRQAGYAYIPFEQAGHFYDLLPERISKHIKAEWRVVPTLTEIWNIEGMDTPRGRK